MFGHPPLYPLPLREGTLPLDTLQLAAGWFIAAVGGDIFVMLAHQKRSCLDLPNSIPYNTKFGMIRTGPVY